MRKVKFFKNLSEIFSISSNRRDIQFVHLNNSYFDIALYAQSSLMFGRLIYGVLGTRLNSSVLFSMILSL